MEEKKVKILIVSILLIIPLIFIGIIVLIEFNKTDKELTSNFISDKYKLAKVYDINEFYNVNSCINNYLNNLNNLNNKAVIELLDKNYINENKIDEKNVINYVDTYNEFYNYSLVNIEVYFNSYYKIYFTKGLYTKEDDEFVYDKKYISHIIIFDITNNTYSVIPMIGKNKSFEEILDNEYLKNYNYEIVSNDNNEIITQNIGEFEEAMLYFSKFKNELLNNCDSSYKLVENGINKTDFIKFCENYTKEYSNSLITNYKKNIDNNGVSLIISDQYGNTFVFKYLEVDNYRVSINLNN